MDNATTVHYRVHLFQAKSASSMKKFTLPLTAAALTLVATATFAQDADEQKAGDNDTALGAVATAPEADDAAEKQRAEEEAREEKRICRRIRLDMSSRRTERVCKTADEWRAFNGVD